MQAGLSWVIFLLIMASMEITQGKPFGWVGWSGEYEMLQSTMCVWLPSTGGCMLGPKRTVCWSTGVRPLCPSHFSCLWNKISNNHNLKEEVNFSSHFIQISVPSLEAPRQDSMAEEHSRGKRACDTAARKQRVKGGVREPASNRLFWPHSASMITGGSWGPSRYKS